MSRCAAALLHVATLCALAAAPACRGESGAPPIGGSCSDARDCETGLCVTVADAGICTITCTDDEACPEGMTCQRFSLAQEGDAGPVGEAVRACASAPAEVDAGQ